MTADVEQKPGGAARGRHFQKPRRRRWWQLAISSIGALLCVTLLAAAGFISSVYVRTGQFETFSLSEVPVDEPVDPGEPENFLIVGSDSREGIDPDDPDFADVQPNAEVGGRRSDTIILARIDPANAQMQMVSFPRDLWVPIDGGGRDRINSAWGQGRDVLIRTIRDNWQIPIHHYVEIDFTGFQALVQAIGGVPVYLDTSYRDLHSGLAATGPGCVTLDGPTALAFARARYFQYLNANGRWVYDPSSDLGRIARQQFLIRKALGRVLSLNPVGDLLTFNRLLEVATDSVSFDEALNDRDTLRALAERFRSFDPDTILNMSLEVRNYTTPGGAAVLLLDEDRAERVFRVFRGVDPGAVLPEDVEVLVRNGSGIEAQAADASAALSALGFAAEADGDADATLTTTVAYGPGSEVAAQLVARHLTSRANLLEDDQLGPGTVVLVTGSDFSTVVRSPWPEEAVPLPTTSTTAPPTTVEDGDDEGTTTTSIPMPTTSTTVIGVIPESPPPGETCP